ncbi:uncharacterized [Tachysurus ichikawai]
MPSVERGARVTSSGEQESSAMSSVNQVHGVTSSPEQGGEVTSSSEQRGRATSSAEQETWSNVQSGVGWHSASQDRVGRQSEVCGKSLNCNAV